MGMNDGEVIKWLKAVGDPIAKGDQLVEIESSKVNAEVEATTDGTLGRIDVEEGRVVDVGTVLGHILEAGDSEGDLPDAAPVAGSASTPAPVAAAAPAAPAAAAPKGGKQIVTPRARRLACSKSAQTNQASLWLIQSNASRIRASRCYPRGNLLP